MTSTPTVIQTDDTDLRYLRRSFVRHLAADGRSEATRRAYVAAITQLDAFLTARGLPTTVRQLRPDDVEAFFVSLYERRLRQSTIATRHQALSRFFSWLVAEGELATSPMAGLPRPAASLPQPTVLSGAQVDALLAACAGSAFEDVRDAAVIRLFGDTGLRLTEMAGLQLDDVDLERESLYQAGIGRVPRAIPFERSTARALDRYLALRADHDHALRTALWLGRRGPLTARGIEQAVRHRGQLAGLPEVRPRHLRHTFVQRYQADGGDGRDLMRLMGWRSRQLLSRYAIGERPQRPRAAWLRLGDRL